MSHEIRTPMNAIIGMTSIGKAAASLDRKDYALLKIEDASVHLLGVINDILDMSKIEANKLVLSPAVFKFEEMLQKVVNIINFRVAEKHLEFTVHLDKNIPELLFCDAQRLAQVIANLLSNAVKFTPEYGSIKLSACMLKREESICHIQVEVSDTGIGISKEQQSRLFTSFEQAESSTTRKYGGTGLGLTISKRIVELMGGNIRMESEPGKGSLFSFTIQAGVPGPEHQADLFPSSISDGRSIRILAVDDDSEVREYFIDISQRLGIDCDVVASGEEALVYICKGSPYDLFFVDWKMPGMDGIELTRRIKENGICKNVVIMISSIDWDEIETEARLAGVDAFIPKPLFFSTIVDCINKCYNIDFLKSAEKQSLESSDYFDGFHVLLAEDVETNREIMLTLLEPTLLGIDCAKNGLEALNMFRENTGRYDLVFMDLQMPEMDGYEATRRIRALNTPDAPTVPIIAITANVFREDIDKCIEAGMNGHLGKPLDFDEVLGTLRKYLTNTKDIYGK
jgi:CheY-like chemotaxis protein/two-component sensor histidine kinase